MIPHLTVHADFEGHPYAEVPPHLVWDLVEFLSFHRPNATYHFDHDCFKVTFHRHTLQFAQELLDHWVDDTNAHELEAQHV